MYMDVLSGISFPTIPKRLRPCKRCRGAGCAGAVMYMDVRYAGYAGAKTSECTGRTVRNFVPCNSQALTSM